MGSLIDDLRRREAAARAEAGELRGQITQLTERLAEVEGRLSRLVITRETVDEAERGRPGGIVGGDGGWDGAVAVWSPACGRGAGRAAMAGRT